MRWCPNPNPTLCTDLQARPELLLDQLPGLLPALLRVVAAGLGDADAEAAAAAAAAAEEAAREEADARAARAAARPRVAKRARTTEPPGAPKVLACPV